LTAEDAKKEYSGYLAKIISRPGVKELAAYLEDHGYFTAPASTKYHLCQEGGLLIHSISVLKLALDAREKFLPGYPEETIILCALFHDAHKATDGFGNAAYFKNNSQTKEQQPYFWNKDQLIFSAGQKSLLIISKFVELSREEMQAIAYHDGPYVPSWEDIKNDAYPLTHLLHFADSWSTFVVERGRGIKYDDKKFLTDKNTLF
jgi:hypothetical protein